MCNMSYSVLLLDYCLYILKVSIHYFLRQDIAPKMSHSACITYVRNKDIKKNKPVL